MQQHHVLVARILLDVPIQLADRIAAAFNGLQEDAPAVAEDAGDPTGGVELERLCEDGVDGFGARIYRAAGVKQTNENVV